MVCWTACSRSSLVGTPKSGMGGYSTWNPALRYNARRWHPGLVGTFFITRKEDNDRNLFFTKAVIDFAMEVIGSKGHWTAKDTTGQKPKGNSVKGTRRRLLSFSRGLCGHPALVSCAYHSRQSKYTLPLEEILHSPGLSHVAYRYFTFFKKKKKKGGGGVLIVLVSILNGAHPI